MLRIRGWWNMSSIYVPPRKQNSELLVLGNLVDLRSAELQTHTYAIKCGSLGYTCPH